MSIIKSVSNINQIIIKELEEQLKIRVKDLKDLRQYFKIHTLSMPETYEKSLKYQKFNEVIKVSEDLEVFKIYDYLFPENHLC